VINGQKDKFGGIANKKTKSGNRTKLLENVVANQHY